MKANFYTRVGLTKASIIPDIEDIPENKDYQNWANVMGKMFLNPESWTDTKSSNWVKHQIPGRSDPAQQWVAGGARIVSFDALVTADWGGTAKTYPSDYFYKISGKNVIKKIGNIGRQIFNIPEISLPDRISTTSSDSSIEQPVTEYLGISDQLDYYRSLVYPVVSENKVFSPVPVRLKVGTTLGQRTLDNATFVIDKLEIKVTKQYPNLTPIEAIVSFALSEIVNTMISSDMV